MIYSDNIDVDITNIITEQFTRRFPNGDFYRIKIIRLRQFENWLKLKNIKYSLVKKPIWNSEVTHINMRKEDAVMFKLVFGL